MCHHLFKNNNKKNKQKKLSWRKPTVRSATPPKPAPLSAKVGSVPVTPAFSAPACHSASPSSWSPSAPLGFRGRRFGAEPFNVLCAAGEVGGGKM